MPQKNQQENSDTVLTRIPIEAGQEQGATPEPLPDDGQSSVSNTDRIEQVGESSTRNATGPRTRRGKMRSRNNARIYGIFSKELVLSNESPIGSVSKKQRIIARNYFDNDGTKLSH